MLERDAAGPGRESIVYLYVGKDIDGALSRAEPAGARIALPKTALPDDMG